MTCAYCNDIQFVGLTTPVGWLIASESGVAFDAQYYFCHLECLSVSNGQRMS